MSGEMFLIVYVFLMVVLIVFEMWVLLKNKGAYLKTSYRSLKSIIEGLLTKNTTMDIIKLSKEIERFYNEYSQEEPQIKKFFPNVVMWLDAIIFRIDCEYKNAKILNDYVFFLKQTRDTLEIANPFNKCEKYQQGILCDINKLKTSENEIIVQNILNRTEEEFLRLSGDIKKNNRQNFVSILIGVIGILVSILMAFANI